MLGYKVLGKNRKELIEHFGYRWQEQNRL
jgi:hypothetical protein